MVVANNDTALNLIINDGFSVTRRLNSNNERCLGMRSWISISPRALKQSRTFFRAGCVSEGLDFFLLISACAIYIFGLQIPTVRINVPLNNRLQALDLETASDPELKEILAEYDSTWLRWNSIRTVVAVLTTALLLLVLLRM